MEAIGFRPPIQEARIVGPTDIAKELGNLSAKLELFEKRLDRMENLSQMQHAEIYKVISRVKSTSDETHDFLVSMQGNKKMVLWLLSAAAVVGSMLSWAAAHISLK